MDTYALLLAPDVRRALCLRCARVCRWVGEPCCHMLINATVVNGVSPDVRGSPSFLVVQPGLYRPGNHPHPFWRSAGEVRAAACKTSEKKAVLEAKKEKQNRSETAWAIYRLRARLKVSGKLRATERRQTPRAHWPAPGKAASG